MIKINLFKMLTLFAIFSLVTFGLSVQDNGKGVKRIGRYKVVLEFNIAPGSEKSLEQENVRHF